MFAETSACLVRAQIASHLIAFEIGADGGEAIALDIIELLALRMAEREDHQVGILGLFVRTNLVALDRNVISFAEALNRFTGAALAAPLGHMEMSQALEDGLRDIFL